MEKIFFRKNTIWYAFYSKFATFTHFEEIQVLLRKNPSIFSKPPILWTFWEIFLFESHFTANLL